MQNPKPLTEARRRLLCDYEKKWGSRQIKACIRDIYGTGLNPSEEEEYIGICNVALCDAALHYDETKGAAFSTYAHMYITSALKAEKRKKRTMMRRHELNMDSLDRTVSPDGEKEITLGEIIPSERAVKATEYEDGIKAFMSILSPLETKIVVMLLLGVKKSDMAYCLDIADKKVDELLWRIQRNKYKEVIYRREV